MGDAAKITIEEFQDAADGYMGWCQACGAFTTPECEPDARNRACAECGGKAVVGAEEAMLAGLFELADG